MKSFFLKRDRVEAEIKIPIDDILPDIDPKAYITKRLGLPLEEVFQIDIYFQSPVNDFHETDEALRVRQSKIQDGKTFVELTYKGPKTGTEMKIREELTIETTNIENTTQILERLGFKPVMEVSKKRINWQNDMFTLSLDDVEGLGEFIEIEMQSSDSPSKLPQYKTKILEFTQMLFPNWKGKNERQSYLELLMMKSVMK